MANITTKGISESHKEMVAKLGKSGREILEALNAEDCHLWHMATGIAGEAGELLDAVKKHVVYRRDVDVINVIEELGDLEFYMEGIRQALGLSRETCLDYNMKKLGQRYMNHVYTDAQAIERNDKK